MPTRNMADSSSSRTDMTRTCLMAHREWDHKMYNRLITHYVYIYIYIYVNY